MGLVETEYFGMGFKFSRADGRVGPNSDLYAPERSLSQVKFFYLWIDGTPISTSILQLYHGHGSGVRGAAPAGVMEPCIDSFLQYPPFRYSTI